MNKTNAAIVRTLLLGTSCLSMFAAGAARAQPVGGTVTLGSATITNHGANSTTIDQTTGKLIINWDSFDIAAGGRVQFRQPNASAIALNRIMGADPTSIYGSLLANGQVWIVNGNGVLFGQGSRIAVGGLIATTSDIADGDFASGNYSFSGGTGATVTNQGTIRTGRRGYAVLSGSGASNQGLIAANTGTVVIGGASAFTVDFQGDGLLSYAITAAPVTATSGQTGASNSGTIQGGRVVMTARAAADVQDAVVNNTGMISASSARLQNGEVILDGGDGDVSVSGTIDSKGTDRGTSGGSVTITGNNITVADNTQIDVSGRNGGGSVRIGGDLNGGGTVPHAASVTVGTATIKADATHSGDGGTVVVWSDGTTDFSGIVSAKGGSSGGNGGTVETAGQSLHVTSTASVDTSALTGTTGNWLLGSSAFDISDAGATLPEDQDPGQSGTIAPSTIAGSLPTTNMTFETGLDITVYDPVAYNAPNALSLLAGGNVYIAADVQNAGTGAINVIAGWDGVTTDPSLFTATGVYGNFSDSTFSGGPFGGSVLVSSNYDLDPNPGPDKIHSVAIGSAGGTTTVAGDAVFVIGLGADSQIGYQGAGGGDIVVRSNTAFELGATGGASAIVGNGLLDGSTNGDATGNIDIESTGFLALGSNDPNNTTWIGNLAGTGFSESGNVTLIGATGVTGYGADLSAILETDLVGGDFTLGFSNDSMPTGELLYNSAHNLTILAAGDLDLGGSIVNDGTGAITLVAGWDGQTLDPGALTQDGAFGRDGASVYVGGTGGDTYVGSEGGTTTVLTGNLYLDTSTGNTQIGYHGAGGGDISVTALGDVDLRGGDPTESGFAAMIGNGALDNSVTDAVTGNISLSVGGTLTLETTSSWCPDGANNSSTVFIGNVGALGGEPASGNLFLLAGAVDDGSDANGTIERFIAPDLANGDVTLAIASSENSLTITDALAAGDHNLTLLTGGNITINADIQAAGSGAITLVAGWDGSQTDPAHVTDSGVFGNSGGSIIIGGASASGSVSVGSLSGTTTIAGNNITLEADNGSAQIGYAGGGATGDIVVAATGYLYVTAAPASTDSQVEHAQIGNGGVFASGDNGGDITINVGGDVVLSGGYGFYNYAQIGNGGDSESWGSNSGDIHVTAGGAVSLIGKDDYAQIGNGGYGSFYSDSGDVTVVAAGAISLTGAGPYGYTQIGNGGQHSSSTADGTVSVSSESDLTLTSGGSNGFALIGNGDGQRAGTGTVSGSVILDVAGATTLDDTAQGGVWLGNQTADGGTVSGDLSITTGSFGASGTATVLTNSILSSIAGGDVFVATTASDLNLLGTLNYNSSHELDLLSAHDIAITHSVQNSGTGAITLVAGWDGQTVGSAADIRAAGAYGLNAGALSLGGSGQSENVSVGSAGGLTTALTGDLTIAPRNGYYAQLGYHGAGSGEIDAFVSGDLTLTAGSGTTDYAMIGNGSRNGDVTDNVSGKIDVEVDFGNTRFINGSGGARAWLGNVTSGGGKASGDVTVLTDFGAVPTDILVADLGTSADTGGNVFMGYIDPNDGRVSFGGLTYNSPHDFTIASPTDLLISSSIQNAGTGEVTMVAGWDEHTVGDSAALIAANAFGLHNSTLTIAGNNVVAGSAGGLTTALGTNIVMGAGTGFAQIGYNGAGAGDITVVATGNLTLNGGSTGTAYAVIGNGGINVSGDVSGNIVVQVGGTTSFVPGSGSQDVGIGNYSNGSNSGNVSIVTGDLGSLGPLDSALAHDLQGGDVTLAITDSTATTTLTGITTYNSAHTLDLLAAGSLTLADSIQNSGTGAINLVAGWNGTTFDPAHFADAGVYGNNSGTLTIGGASASGSVAVGSAGGTTTALGYDLDVSAANGFSQLGYAGNSSGNIVAMATHDVSVTTSGSLVIALIGNGGVGAETTNVSGDIAVTAAHSVFVTAAGTNSGAKIGNGQINGVGTVSGTITVTALTGDVALSTAADTTRAQIGNGFETQSDVSGAITVSGNTVSLATGSSNSSAMIGNSGSARMTGDILVDATDVSLLSAFDSSSTQIGNGGSTAVDGPIAGSVLYGGNITIDATNSLSLTTTHSNAGAFIGNGGDGSGMGLTTSGALTYSGDIAVNVGTSGHAGTLTLSEGGSSDVYIGNGGFQTGAGTTAAGGISQTGDITVTVLGGTTHGASMLVSDSGTGIARIGNGGAVEADASIGGDIDIAVDGSLQFVSGGPNVAYAGNRPYGSTNETGNLTIAAQSLSGVEGSLNNALGGGDVLIEVLGTGPFTLGAPVTYNSAHTLEVLAAGNVVIGGTVQNAGSGAIDVVAGWNGSTTDPAHLGDAGVYGNNGGSITIGGADASGNASLGSAGGATNLYAQDVTLSSLNGYAQLGYAGSGAGTVNVLALGTVTLSGGGDLAHFAQIGSGSTFGTSTAAEVNITAASIQGIGTESIDANDLSLTAGAVGSSNASLQIAANALTLATGGGSAYLTTPRSLSIASADLAGGNLQISANGAITQTGAILSGTLNVSTTSGAITLINTGNAVAGTVSLSTPGAASFTDSLDLSMGASTVGGTLTLVGPSISQTDAIVADRLNVTATAGDILLENSGNSFGALTLSTTGSDSAEVADSTAVALGASTVGGHFTLNAGGAVTQTGAIVSNALYILSTSGDVTLTNAGNSFGSLYVSTVGTANASLVDTSSVTVEGAAVGGTFNLTAASIDQTDFIHAGALNVTATSGAIVLNSAGNAFSRLAVSTTGGNDASVVDSTGFQLDTSNVGGTLTFLAGGTVTQPGTLHSGGLSASTTTGDIVLGDAGNAVSGTVAFHSAGSAYFNDTLSIAVGPSTAGGLLTLISGGGISQSGAIQASSLAVTANGGDIALNDTGNSFASLRASASGNASVTDASALTVDGATVNGALTLVGASINQSGAIQAASLSATANNGGIVLNDSRNSFATLSLATSGANTASVADSTGVTLAGANVGGTLTLLAGGAVGQSAALHSGGLIVATTTGDIVLTNASNAVSGTVAFTTPGAASFTDTLSVSMGQSSVGGLLTLVSGGGIGQSGAITAAGLNATANGGSIALGSSGNSFATLTVAASGDATVSDATAVSLGGANVAGAFTLTAGGAITQTGAISSGSLNVSTTTGAITLTNAGNAFGGLTVTTHGSDNASFAQASQLSVASANVGGTLSLTAGTSIGQTGAIMAASLSATANCGDVVLTNTSNAFSTLGVSASGNAGIWDKGGLTILGAGVGGTLTLSAGGAVGQSGSIHSAGLSVTTTAGDIVLTKGGNAVSGTASFHTPGAVSFTDSLAMNVGASSAGGLLTLVSGGGITQSGAILASGLAATANGGAIALTDAGNSFATLTVSTVAGNASVTDSRGVTLGASTVGGKYSVAAAGAVGHSGALQSAGLAVMTTSGNIVLTNAANAISANVTFATPGAASFTNSLSTTMRGASVGGLLTLVSGGGISQTGAITAGGLSATANGGAILLANTGNTFTTLAVSTSGDATVTDSTGVSLGASAVGGTLTLAAGGAVGQSGALQSAGLSVTASGDIVLTNGANAVSGTAGFNTPGAASFNDALSVNLGATSVGGLFSLVSGGGITQSGAIQAGSFSATANGGDIVLTDGGNGFATLALAATGDAAVTDSTGVTLGASTIGGDLTLSAGGAVSQSGALQSAGLSVTTTSGDIVLTNASNAVSGTVAFGTPGAASFDNTLSTIVGASSVGGLLTLVSDGGISQTGAIAADGLSATANDGTIDLTNGGNSFNSLTLASTGDASVTDSTGVTLGASTIGGLFTLSAGGAVGQSGALQSAGLSVTTTTGDIVLTNVSNAVSGTVAFSTPGAASFNDALSVNAGASSVGGLLTLVSGGGITQSGTIVAGGLSATASDSIVLTDSGNSFATLALGATDDATVTDSTGVTLGASTIGGALTLTAGGAVGQSGALQSAGLSVTTTTGDIALTNASNAVSGTVAFSTPGAASFTDASSVNVGASTVGGLLSLVSGGGITQSGAIQAGSLSATANGGAIVLTDGGNSFAALTLAATGDAAVTDSTGVTLGASTVGGKLTLSAAGAVGQSGALQSAGLSVTTSSGDIALANGSNAVSGTVAFNTPGAASFNDTLSTTVGTSSIGGLLSLVSGGGISQSGAIAAGGLSATANGGDIVLGNAGNAFATLSLTASGAASVTDGSAMTVAGASVGGALTLVDAASIAQSGAIKAASLNATANGGIALTNSGNSFATLTLSTTAGNDASVVDSTGVTLAASTIGGKLTLSAGGAVGQSGALQSAGLSVTTSAGDIVLTNAANAVTGAVAFNTPGAASFTDTASIGLGASSVGGPLTLVSAGGISQTGAVQSASLNATANGGAIVLTNSGNSFATLTLSTASDASVTDTTGVTLAASSIGGKLTLAAGGAVAQSGALHSVGLNVSTTSGAIALTNTANAVSGAVQFGTPGAVTFYDTLGLSVGASTVGGDLVLLSKGNVGVTGTVQSNSGAITIVAGWDGATTSAAQLGSSGVYGNANGSVTVGGTGATGNAGIGSKSGATAVYAYNLNILGTNGAAQLGYHGAGGGAIKVVALHNVTLTAGAGSALLGNGSLGNDVSGAVTGDIDVRLGGTIAFAGGANGKAWLGNAAPAGGSETGNLILVASDESTDAGTDLGNMVVSALGGGDVTLGFTGTGDQGPGKNYSYNSSHAFSYLAGGNLVFAGSIQNAGSGAINLVAGWDGHTLTPSSFGQSGVYGNNGKGVTIGGANATGGVAVGSAGGTTSVYGASLLLAAANGYAQLGFNGHGAGAIAVTTTGAVTLTGGASAGDFAQIGNGGLKTSGNNSGDIAIIAGGDIVLTGGAGSEAYVQIGHGGAESNTGASGYSNTGAIALTAADLTLGAGAGSAAYAQVGQGGYESGLNLAGGQALNGGNITVTVGHLVSLTGNGTDAYAQIGNGGDQSNLNPSAAAGGTDSGDIVVSAPNGPNGAVSLTSGAGANAYSQIGNGGYAVNAGVNATVASFMVTGNVTVTDLALTGGGANGYSLIGGGDASHNSVANVIGNVVIDANGNIIYTAGTGEHSQATIGNFTGKGTLSGTVTGATPPPEITNDPGTIGVIVSSTANAKPNTNTAITTITTTVVSGEEQNGGASSLTAHIETAPPGPLASLGGGDSSAPNTSDNATVVIADSLDGAKKAAATQTIVAGMLSQSNPTSASHTVHAIPPADQDFSSWGNEALWQ